VLAKIGSEFDKPDGLTLLTHVDVPVRIWSLPLRKVNGIGPKATERLAALGIATVGELPAAAGPASVSVVVTPFLGNTSATGRSPHPKCVCSNEVRKHVFTFSEKDRSRSTQCRRSSGSSRFSKKRASARDEQEALCELFI